MIVNNFRESIEEALTGVEEIWADERHSSRWVTVSFEDGSDISLSASRRAPEDVTRYAVRHAWNNGDGIVICEQYELTDKQRLYTENDEKDMYSSRDCGVRVKSEMRGVDYERARIFTRMVLSALQADKVRE